MLRKALISLVLFVFVLAGAAAYAQRLSHLGSWELSFSSKPPRVIDIKEESGLQAYTYVVYEVKNTTSDTIDFYPTFEIETEDGKIARAGSHPAVHKALVEQLVDKYLPFDKMIGDLKAGESRRGIAIFKGVDPAADKLTVYVAGLSGDFKTTVDSEGKVVALYRTYKMVYKRPGDRFVASLDTVTLESSEWVWH